MNTSTPVPIESVPVRVEQMLDSLCDRFEQACQAGQQPSIEDFLAQGPADAQTHLLAELLRLDLTYRLARHESPLEAVYQRRFGGYEDIVQAVFAAQPEPLPQATPELLLKWKFSWLVNQVLMPPEQAETETAPYVPHSAPPETPNHVANGALETPAAPIKTTRAEAAALGKLDRDYVFLGRLGSGGMGVVYKAMERSTNRLVALKLIRPDKLEGITKAERQAWLESFRQAAELSGKLEHEHIVPLYHVGEERGQPYYVMRYIEGRSLGEIVRDEGPLPMKRAARYIENMARAVHFAHANGILHVDLKPRNMLIDARSDTVYLVDFGLARPIAALDIQSTIGPVGTFPYMSPEQAQGRPKFHVAGDVYGLGASLYDLVAGRPPFHGADPIETLRQVRESEPISPRHLNPALDRDLETIILKCLNKEPARRYVSAAELADDLANYRQDRPIKARPVGTLERSWRWCRRNPKPALSYAAATLGVLCLTALSAYAVQMDRVIDAEKRATAAEKESAGLQKIASDAAAWRERGQEQCERGQIAVGLLWKARGLEMAPTPPEDLVDYARLDLAAWSWSLHRLKSYLPHGDHLITARFSDDSKLIVTGDALGRAKIWDVATGNLRQQEPLAHGQPIRTLAISSDSRLLALCSDRDVTIWELATGRARRSWRSQAASRILTAAFRNVGQTLVVVLADGTVQRWATDTGGLLGGYPTLARVECVAFSPNADLMLVGASAVPSKGIAQLFEVESGRPIGSLMDHDDPVHSAAFAPNGATVFTGSGFEHSGRGAVHQWKTADGGLVNRIPAALTGPVSGLAVHPKDGRLFISVAKDEPRELYTWDLINNRLLSTAPLHRAASFVIFDRDCGNFLTGGIGATELLGGTELWEVAPGPHLDVKSRLLGDINGLALTAADTTMLAAGLRGAWLVRARDGNAVPLGQEKRVYSVAMHPAGTIAATAGSSGITLWDASSGLALEPLENATMSSVRVVFDPTGSFVAGAMADGELRIWDVAARRLIARKEGINITALAFAPNGHIVTGTWEGAVRSWELPDIKPVGTSLQHESSVFAIAFSPDGKQILTGSGDATAQIWDFATGVPLGPPLTHNGSVRAVAFSPDGKLAATGSSKATARLWHVATGKPIGPPLIHVFRVSAVAFSNDGKALLTAGDDSIRAWQIPAALADSATDLRRRVEFHSGLTRTPRGAARHLTVSDWNERRFGVNERGALPDN